MIRAAVIDDDAVFVNKIDGFLKQFSKEKNCPIMTTPFSNPTRFIMNYTPVYDVVFMDIQMPQMNGMDAAKKLRQLDKDVCLVFTTNMIQYAIKGYEVDAIGYMVKPLDYFSFSVLMRKVLEHTRSRTDMELLIKTDDAIRRVRVNDLAYVEVLGHYLNYHLTDGTQLKELGPLGRLEEKLAQAHFFRCNNCYLVNLRHVMKVEGTDITVCQDVLQISRRRKKEFLTALNEYLGRGIG